MSKYESTSVLNVLYINVLCCQAVIRNLVYRFLCRLQASNNSLVMSIQSSSLYMLGAICGSAQSMDLPAQSMDPLSSIVCADIHGCLRNLWILRRMQIIPLIPRLRRHNIDRLATSTNLYNRRNRITDCRRLTV